MSKKWIMKARLHQGQWLTVYAIVQMEDGSKVFLLDGHNGSYFKPGDKIIYTSPIYDVDQHKNNGYRWFHRSEIDKITSDTLEITNKMGVALAGLDTNY